MAEVLKTAREGRPGSVVVDLPLDVQLAEIDLTIGDYQPLRIGKPAPRTEDIRAALRMIAEARSPVMIIGGGPVLAEACDECVKPAEALSMPLITTYMTTGGIPSEHPLYVGHMGIEVGPLSGNKALDESGLVLGVGCRFIDRH
ncbi:MAG: glyoxylate carboligase, partial [Anaerolineae bacterium]|nr:glyoxylate carboligase [Anaerolineae bacterium]